MLDYHELVPSPQSTFSEITWDDAQYITSSEYRIKLLNKIHEGQSSKKDLHDLQIPRSTVSRTISQLVERGWIMENSQEYEITDVGNQIRENFLSFMQTIAPANEFARHQIYLPDCLARELGEYIICDDFEFSIVRSSKAEPYAPLSTVKSEISKAKSIHCSWPVVNELYHDPIKQHINNGNEIEIIMSSKTWKNMSMNEDDLAEIKCSRKNRLSIHKLDRHISYGILITNRIAILSGFDDSMNCKSIFKISNKEQIPECVIKRYSNQKDEAKVIIQGTAPKVDGR